MDRLPPELLERIFDFLSPRDQAMAAMAGRRLGAAAAKAGLLREELARVLRLAALGGPREATPSRGVPGAAWIILGTPLYRRVCLLPTAETDPAALLDLAERLDRCLVPQHPLLDACLGLGPPHVFHRGFHGPAREHVPGFVPRRADAPVATDREGMHALDYLRHVARRQL